jgi:hypothetical protein
MPRAARSIGEASEHVFELIKNLANAPLIALLVRVHIDVANDANDSDQRPF